MIFSRVALETRVSFAGRGMEYSSSNGRLNLVRDLGRGKIALQQPSVTPPHRLKQLEIFPLLPVRDLGAVARDLGFLDTQIIVDEILAEARGKAGITAQLAERLLETFGQKRRRHFIGRVCEGAGIEPALNAVETRPDLRRHVEIRIGGGLARPILEPRDGIAA